VSLNATTVGNGTTQPFHVELMALNARNVEVYCQGRNFREWRCRVIDKSTLQNRVMYYVGEEFDLGIV